jgi:hypothetical protein
MDLLPKRSLLLCVLVVVVDSRALREGVVKKDNVCCARDVVRTCVLGACRAGGTKIWGKLSNSAIGLDIACPSPGCRLSHSHDIIISTIISFLQLP